MAENKYIEQIFNISCRGRNPIGGEVLERPVNVIIKIYQSPGSDTISSDINCKYNTGGHRQRCKASHPNQDKIGRGVICPYSFDIPYALEHLNTKKSN